MPPPRTVELPDGCTLDLEALAGEICRRYHSEFPDEEERYGSAGRLWCLHDNQHLLRWAVWDGQGLVVMEDQVSWLARVLEARDFPLPRLARDLRIAAEVVREHAPAAADAAARLDAAAALVERHGTFL
jgi:hypothetical protein